MKTTQINPEDFPFEVADLLGLKKKPKPLTPTQELGRRLIEISKQHKPNSK